VRCGVAVVLAAALTVAAWLGAAPRAQAQAVLRVGKAQATPFDFTPLDVGMAKGFFAKRGLTIDEQNFAGSAKLHQGIAADAIDIGLGSGPELAFVAKGAPELGVYVFAGPPDGLVLIARKDGPIHDAADLRGKKVSVSTVGSLTEWMVRETSRQQGWGPNGIDIVYLGTPPAQVAALETKQIDASSSDIASAADLDRRGVARIVVKFGDIVPEFINHVTYASTKIIAAHPEEVRAFLAGWTETIRFMRANKAETVRITAPVMHVSEEIAAATYDTVMPEFSETGRFEAKPLAVLARSFVETGQFTAPPDMSKLYTEKFLPGAPATH
jgi:ABC-type nitrate/sulfonate/bicarbonate transport system substrate-binding protein